MTLATRTIAAILIASFVLSLGPTQPAQSCSRVLHASKDGSHVVTGRTMDWYEDVKSNLWAFPRGLQRDGAGGTNSLTWVSKYGSVITAGFDVGTADGLNEKGLAVNMLYLGETDFGARDKARPGISWSAYTQYLLDSFATVAEAVEAMKGDTVQVVASPLPGSTSKPPTIHFALSDASGDSAIFEYIGGKLVIHHGRQYIVMTNSPAYSEQLALNAYWETVGGEAMLPGTRRAADRYVRASYYAKQLPDPATDRQSLANVMSVMRNVSVPFGAIDPKAPNIAPTIWRTVADNVGKMYLYESTLSPNVVWVRLDRLDLSAGAPVKKLTLIDNYDLVGDVSAVFQPAKPFAFAGVQ
jgi:choloylglycine hydrolase